MDITSEVVVRPPEDSEGLARVRAALEELKGRLDPSVGPALQMLELCEVALLERAGAPPSFFWKAVMAVNQRWRPQPLARLLQRRQVDLYGVSRQLLNAYGDDFYEEDFDRACYLVIQLCQNGHHSVGG